MEAVSSRTIMAMARAEWWKTRSAVARPGSSVRGSSTPSGASGFSRRSAEAAIDVVPGAGVDGIPEHLLRGVGLDDDAGRPLLREEERALLRDAHRLLHVVGDDHDRHGVGELADGLLDAAGRGGVKGRARLVHEEHVRIHGQGAGDAEALLLAAGQGAARLVQAIPHLFPQAGSGEALLQQLLPGIAVHPPPGALQPRDYVVGDGP